MIARLKKWIVKKYVSASKLRGYVVSLVNGLLKKPDPAQLTKWCGIIKKIIDFLQKLLKVIDKILEAIKNDGKIDETEALGIQAEAQLLTGAVLTDENINKLIEKVVG